MANKYHNKKIQIDGYTFDSLKEAGRYQELKLLQKSGEVLKFEVHPSIELQPGFKDHNGIKFRGIHYEPDFVVYYNGRTEVEDVKGMRTDVYKLKKKMLLFKNRDMIFKEL